MALLHYLNNRQQHIARRVFRYRRNPLDYMDDVEIVKKYRLDRQSIYELCQELMKDLHRNTGRNQALP